MRTYIIWTINLLLAICLAPCGASLAADAAPDAAADPAQPALAERFAMIAQNILRDRQVTAPLWQQSAALLDAARRLDPTEERYARLLVEAAMQTGDTATVIDALNACRKFDPTNQHVQVQLIGVHISRMETADQKIAYLSRIVDQPSVSAEVRSVAAVLAARCLDEQAKKNQALTMLNRALAFNPLNPEALRLHYEWIDRYGAPAQRVSAMLAMLQANPAQPQVAARLAREAADASLLDAAIAWYSISANLTQRMGQALSPDLIREYASLQLMQGQVKDANQTASLLVSIDSDTLESWYVRLIAQRQLTDKKESEKVRGLVLNVLLNQLAVVRKAAGSAQATTRPISTPPETDLPDLTEDVARINKPAQANLKPAFISALRELAWFQLYFNDNSPAANPLLTHLKGLLPKDDPSLVLLEGWKYLLDGKKEEAHVKLSAIADREPLAALGLIRILSADNTKADATRTQSVKLLLDCPAGRTGLILWEALHDSAGKLPMRPEAASIRQHLDQFPKDWLAILDQPQQFYSIQGEAFKVSHEFGEPILAKITIRNISQYNLTMGPDGIVQPDLWFDTQLRGVTQQTVPGSAFDRLSRQLVLHPGESVSQTVCLNQAALNQLLESNPSTTVQAYVSVFTNPVSSSKGVNPGPGGYRVRIQPLIERTSIVINSDDAKQRMYTALAAASPVQKFYRLELLTAYIGLFSSEKAPPALEAVAAEFADVIRRNGSDPSQAVQSWAGFLATLTGKEANRQRSIESLLSDAFWAKRLLGLIALRRLPPEKQNPLAASLASTESDPTVKLFAKAMVDQLKTVPTTKPSTHPSTTAPR